MPTDNGKYSPDRRDYRGDKRADRRGGGEVEDRYRRQHDAPRYQEHRGRERDDSKGRAENYKATRHEDRRDSRNEKYRREDSTSRRVYTPPQRVTPEHQDGPSSGSRKGNTPQPTGVRDLLKQELLKQGKHKLAATQATTSSDEDGEQGEILDNGRKRKHSPIVWAPPEKQPRSDNIMDRTDQELLDFQLHQEELGYDPDAPALIKSSPSFSGSPGDGHNGQHNNHDEEDGSPHQSVAQGRSRWLDDAAEDEEQGVPAPAPSIPGPASAPAPAVGQAAQLPNYDSDNEDFDAGSDAADEPELPQGVAMNRQHDMMRECRFVELFEKIDRISEGTYGVVYRARERGTGRIVALKRIKMEKEKDGFPLTSVREINILLNLHHPNIVNVEEVVVAARNPDHIFMVMEYMDHDLKSLMEDKSKLTKPFSVGEVKCLMLQLLKGVAYLHENWVLHRDLKTSNILYNSKGELKICDFGLARQYGSPLRDYTHLVVTLWYRAPELLLGQKIYSTAIDMWSLGCIMAELLTGKPLFDGKGELEQIDKIVCMMGTPDEANWPGLKELPNYKNLNLRKVPPGQLRAKFQGAIAAASLTHAGFDLLSGLLDYNPEKRLSAVEALNHPWFKESPLPQRQELMPTFSARRPG